MCEPPALTEPVVVLSREFLDRVLCKERWRASTVIGFIGNRLGTAFAELDRVAVSAFGPCAARAVKTHSLVNDRQRARCVYRAELAERAGH